MAGFLYSVLGIFRGLIEVSRPIVDFLSESRTIGDYTYTIGDWFFGAGLVTFLILSLAKWIIGIVT